MPFLSASRRRRNGFQRIRPLLLFSPYYSIMRTAFVCYDRSQRHTVEALAKDIRSLGWDPWFDREIKPSDNWWPRILEKSRTCDVFIYAFSAESASSEACDVESRWAADCDRILLPVQLESGSISGLPAFAASRQAIKYEPDSRTSLKQLEDALAGIPPTPPQPEPLPPAPDPPGFLVNSINELAGSSTPDPKEQQGLVDSAAKRNWREEEIDDAITALRRLRGNPVVIGTVRDKIDRVLADLTERRSPADAVEFQEVTLPDPPELPDDDALVVVEEKKETSALEVIGGIVVVLFILGMMQSC